MQLALDEKTHDLIFPYNPDFVNLVRWSEQFEMSNWVNKDIYRTGVTVLGPDGVSEANKYGSTWTYGNLLTWSEEFDNTDWVGAANAVAYAGEDVNGNYEAFTLSDLSATENESLAQTVTTFEGDVTTIAIYLKQGSAAETQIDLAYSGGTLSKGGVTVDWATKTVTGFNGAEVSIIGGIVTNFWYLVTVTFPNDSGTGNTSLTATIWPSGWIAGGSLTGDVHAFGAQLTRTTAEEIVTYVQTEAVAIPKSSQTWVGQTFTEVATNYVTISTYVKRGIGDIVHQTVWNDADVMRQYFDIGNRKVLSAEEGDTVKVHKAGIKILSNGWLRVWTTVVNPELKVLNTRQLQLSQVEGDAFTDTRGLFQYVWGAQVTSSDKLTNYIKMENYEIPVYGGVERVTDGRYTVQLVKNRLLTALGEWLLDPRIGWLSLNDFEKNPDLFDIELRARSIILNTPDVKTIEEMKLELRDRVLHLDFQATTTFGLIDLTIPWGN